MFRALGKNMLLRKFNELSILVGVFPRHWSTNHLRERKERISRRRRITYFQFWCSWRHWSDRRWSQTRCLARNRQQPAPTLPGKAEIEDQLIKSNFMKWVFYPHLTLHDGLHPLSPLHFLDVCLDVHRPHVLFILKTEDVVTPCARDDDE